VRLQAYAYFFILVDYSGGAGRNWLKIASACAARKALDCPARELVRSTDGMHFFGSHA
jgi:hypothetical protein